MALPDYGGAIQRRMQEVGGPPQFNPVGAQQPGGSNQFQVPQTPNNIQPPNFYHMPTQQSPVGQNYSGQYNPNYSGPIYNPYQPPSPYGGMKVSPTGRVEGLPPQGPGMAREAAPGDNGSGPNGGQNTGQSSGGGGNGGNNNNGGNNGGNNNGGGGSQNGGKGDNKGGFLQGFYKGIEDKPEAFLRSDPALQDTLRQLLGSQGDYRSQFANNMGNIEDAWHTAHNYLTKERGSALQDMEGGLASSGLSRSSGAGAELSGIRRDYGNQLEQALQQKQVGKTEALTEKQNFMRQLELAKLQARSDALRRFAAEQMDVGGLL